MVDFFMILAYNVDVMSKSTFYEGKVIAHSAHNKEFELVSVKCGKEQEKFVFIDIFPRDFYMFKFIMFNTKIIEGL